MPVDFPPVLEVGGLYGLNVQTLGADKTLTPGTDEIYQYLDEGGANRIITLATVGATAGDRFVIGEMFDVTAIPNPGWYFDKFTGDGWETRANSVHPRGCLMTSVTAHFIRGQDNKI